MRAIRTHTLWSQERARQITLRSPSVEISSVPIHRSTSRRRAAIAFECERRTLWDCSLSRRLRSHVTDVNESVVLTQANASVSGNVLTQLTNTGTWSDPESGSVTLSASLGTVIKNVDGTWSWSHTPSVALLGEVVTISATDGTNVSTTTFNVTAYTTIATRGIQYVGATGVSASTFACDGQECLVARPVVYVCELHELQSWFEWFGDRCRRIASDGDEQPIGGEFAVCQLEWNCCRWIRSVARCGGTNGCDRSRVALLVRREFESRSLTTRFRTHGCE